MSKVCAIPTGALVNSESNHDTPKQPENLCLLIGDALEWINEFLRRPHLPSHDSGQNRREIAGKLAHEHLERSRVGGSRVVSRREVLPKGEPARPKRELFFFAGDFVPQFLLRLDGGHRFWHNSSSTRKQEKCSI